MARHVKKADLGRGTTDRRRDRRQSGRQIDHRDLGELHLARGSIIYYPPQPPDLGASQFGVSAHTDYGCLTILSQDSNGGLQVRNRAGEWIAAPPIPGTFVINIGDLLARWTNDVFTSTPHRVINASGRPRYSIAVFFDPDYDTPIEALPACVKPGTAPAYPPVSCGDYIVGRFDKAFAYRK